MKWFILLLGIAANAAASICMKFALIPPRVLPSLSDLGSFFRNFPLWIGVLLYGLAFSFYALALTRFPLHIAHPILTSGAIAIVAASSFWLFKEPFSWTTGIGITLVIVGVVLITYRMPS